MDKITDQQLQEISTLMDNKRWEDAENDLLKLSKTGNSKVYYYLGHVYNAWDNSRKDEKKAKRYFGFAAESSNPVAGAFIYLARNERNKTHAIRILRKGLQSFPRNEAIYYQLFNYTEPSKKENIYREILKKECVSERIKINMAVTYFHLKEYKKTVEISSGFEAEEEWDRSVLACIKGFSLYETGKIVKANKIFSKLIEEDINHKLNYIPRFGLIPILLSQDKLSKAEQLLEEIPLDINIYEGAYPILEPGPWGESYIDAEEHFHRAIDLIIKKTSQKKIKGIVRALRGLFLYSGAFDSEPTEKKLQATVRKDLEFAIKEFPQNKEITKHLFLVYKESNPAKAWKFLIQYVLYGGEDIYEYDDFINDVDDRLFEDFLSDFQGKADDSYDASKLCKFFLNSIISRMYNAKRYKDISLTTSKFNDTQLAESDVMFETAYSYHEEKNLPASKKYYQLYMSMKGDSNAALNNLGLIFERTGDLSKAKNLFQKAAQLDSEDEICRRNLKRVEDGIKKKSKADYLLQEAVGKYRNESPYVHKKLLDFYGHRNQDGLIICSYRQAPQFLKMSGAKDFLKDLLFKNFFIKVTDHEYETSSNVYRLNPYIEPELAKLEESLKDENELLTLCDKLNIENLNHIGYNSNLLRNIAKISSEELKIMLQRDLKENALAVILRQNKSALVLSGSIIEAILTDRISAKNITKYKLGNKTKSVLRMDLSDLLEVSEKEKIIDSTMAHLSHGVRGYRNLIHPGVEQRKGSIQVNDPNVELAWGIVKKLLNEIQ